MTKQVWRYVFYKVEPMGKKQTGIPDGFAGWRVEYGLNCYVPEFKNLNPLFRQELPDDPIPVHVKMTLIVPLDMPSLISQLESKRDDIRKEHIVEADDVIRKIFFPKYDVHIVGGKTQVDFERGARLHSICDQPAAWQLYFRPAPNGRRQEVEVIEFVEMNQFCRDPEKGPAYITKIDGVTVPKLCLYKFRGNIVQATPEMRKRMDAIIASQTAARAAQGHSNPRGLVRGGL